MQLCLLVSTRLGIAELSGIIKRKLGGFVRGGGSARESYLVRAASLVQLCNPTSWGAALCHRKWQIKKIFQKYR